MAHSLLEIAQFLAFPWVFMCNSLSYLPGTVLRLIRHGSLLEHLRPGGGASFRDAWFSEFWGWAGPNVRANASRIVVPLLQGRVRAGEVVVVPQGEEQEQGGCAENGASPPPSLPHPPVSGTVIEVGPGSGMWLPVLADVALQQRSSSSSRDISGKPDASTDEGLRHRGSDGGGIVVGGGSKVQRILGVEPNTGVHGALAAAVEEAGLAGVYEIVPAGIEQLAATGKIAHGEADCIVSVLCLCSIPDPERNIAELYRYLKPGGRWYVYEHVRCRRDNIAMLLYQAFVNLFWPHLIGGCRLRNETGKYLRKAGPWSDVDLASPPDEPWFSTLPHILGVLTK